MNNNNNDTQDPGGSRRRIRISESVSDDSCREFSHLWRDWKGRIFTRKAPIFLRRKTLLQSGQCRPHGQGWVAVYRCVLLYATLSWNACVDAETSVVVPTDETVNVSGQVDLDSPGEPEMLDVSIRQTGKNSGQHEDVSSEATDENQTNARLPFAIVLIIFALIGLVQVSRRKGGD